MLKVKIWIETTLTGSKRFVNTYATVKKLSNGLYNVVSLDGNYTSNSDKLINRVFYTQ